MKIFEGISETEIKELLNCLGSKFLTFKKNGIILSNASNLDILSIVISGKAQIIRVDYNGNKTIIETLEKDDIFEPRMFNLGNNELNIIALEDTEMILIDYDKIMYSCAKHCLKHSKFIENLLQIIIENLNHSYERIQILTKKTIRDKLLEYFKFISNKKNKKQFKLPISITDLASYLAIDRSSLSRELKLLKEDGFIEINNKIVKINY